jgi:lipoprotein-releasing system permease protein
LSTFFIIIIEQIQTIGIFKAIGMKNKDISTIFIIVAGKIILKSLLIGNAIALLLAFLQQKFHLIALDVDTYYVPYVPISLSLTAVVLLNLLVFILCIGALLIPGWFVASRISPVNAIRFE